MLLGEGLSARGIRILGNGGGDEGQKNRKSDAGHAVRAVDTGLWGKPGVRERRPTMLREKGTKKASERPVIS